MKSELFCPRFLNEKLFVSNNSQPKDVLAAPEQKAVVADFAGAGRFLVTFSRDEKVMIERLEENTSEQLRLMTAIEYNGKRRQAHSKFLLSQKKGSVAK